MLQVTKNTLDTLISTLVFPMSGFVVSGLLLVTICINDRLMQMFSEGVKA